MKLPDHPSSGYVEDVLNGNIVACRYVKLACERHVYDLETGHERGLYFDLDAADRRLNFNRFCCHYEGEWAGQPFVPEPWQVFIKSSLYGWKRADGMRRFRTGYVQVARKNGKSTDSATDGLYLFMADGEPGAQVFCAATKKDQAAIVHRCSAEMVKKSPSLRKRIVISKLGRKNHFNLSFEAMSSKYEPLGKDSDTEDGLNVHGAIVDEVHAHRDRGMWDVLETATGARRQPLIIAITTAGFNQSSIGYELYEYSAEILKSFRDPAINDDTFFAIIYTIDLKTNWPDLKTEAEYRENSTGIREDDWRDESIWPKANPNLGVSVKLDDLQRKAQKAKVIPAALNNFLTKHLDVWTQQAERWIALDLWDENNIRPVDETALRGRVCTGGIDLSSVSDLTVWVMLFPDPTIKDLIDILIRVWCPKPRLFDKENKYRDRYQAWERQGLLKATEGDVIDYDFVRKQIVDDSRRFKVDSISIDRLFQGYEFAEKLDTELGGRKDKPKLFACGMGYISMAPLVIEFERRLMDKKLNHGGNPILRWMADNVSVTTGPAGDKKPNKRTSQGKIDGIIGILLGLDRLLRVKLGPKGNDGSLI